jgi:hypothetical protein
MERFLWICLAGAFGTGARYLISSSFASFSVGPTNGGTRRCRVRFSSDSGPKVSRAPQSSRGVVGFGAHSVIHTAGLIELSTDLSVVIEVVEDQTHVDRLLPVLDEMITGGALVTVEQVRVLRYAAGPKRQT